MADWSASYNARLTKPETIARSFVRHPEFEGIGQFKNKILIGPRGVGKTTLLKLLTPSGLYHLRKRKDFSEFGVDYLPLYIPADTLWKGEAQAIKGLVDEGRNNLTPEIGRLIQSALFVDYCFYEIIASLQDAINVGSLLEADELPSWAIDLTRPQEAELCLHLANVWGLASRPMSLLGIKLALNERQNYYASFVSGLRSIDARQLLDEEPLDFFVKVRPLFDVVEALIGRRSWSLQFDEMEIAPRAILERVYQNLRSFDQRAVIKFSLFPYADFLEISDGSRPGRTSPQEGPDFDAVILSGQFRAQGLSFSRSLVGKICDSHGVKVEDIIDYANSPIDRKFVDFNKRGAPERRYTALFRELARKDQSFSKYLASKKIDVSKIAEMTKAQQAERIRKISALAEFRNIHVKSFKLRQSGTGGTAATIPRKSYVYYFGFERLLYLTEQNPRAVHFYFDELIRGHKAGRKASATINEIIRINVDRFRALFATQVVPNRAGKVVTNILEFVDIFGYEVRDRLLLQEFTERPALSFELTKEVGAEALILLGIAINAGAMIPDTEGGKARLLGSLVGTRFRVSNQIAPFYPVPVVLGEVRKVSSLAPIQDREPDLLSWADDNA